MEAKFLEGVCQGLIAFVEEKNRAALTDSQKEALEFVFYVGCGTVLKVFMEEVAEEGEEDSAISIIDAISDEISASLQNNRLSNILAADCFIFNPKP